MRWSNKTFNGKTYKPLNDGYRSLKQAQNNSRRLRDKGMQARVVPIVDNKWGQTWYVVYFYDPQGRY